MCASVANLCASGAEPWASYVLGKHSANRVTLPVPGDRFWVAWTRFWVFPVAKEREKGGEGEKGKRKAAGCGGGEIDEYT